MQGGEGGAGILRIIRRDAALWRLGMRGLDGGGAFAREAIRLDGCGARFFERRRRVVPAQVGSRKGLALGQARQREPAEALRATLGIEQRHAGQFDMDALVAVAEPPEQIMAGQSLRAAEAGHQVAAAIQDVAAEQVLPVGPDQGRSPGVSDESGGICRDAGEACGCVALPQQAQCCRQRFIGLRGGFGCFSRGRCRVMQPARDRGGLVFHRHRDPDAAQFFRRDDEHEHILDQLAGAGQWCRRKAMGESQPLEPNRFPGGKPVGERVQASTRRLGQVRADFAEQGARPRVDMTGPFRCPVPKQQRAAARKRSQSGVRLRRLRQVLPVRSGLVHARLLV